MALMESQKKGGKLEPQEINIKGQKGPQTDFLSTDADLAVFGGSA